MRWFVDPGVPDAAMAGSWRSLAAQAFVASVARPPGPVHLDLRFRDPLVGRAGALPPGRDQGRPWHRPQIGTAPDSATARGAGRRGRAAPWRDRGRGRDRGPVGRARPGPGPGLAGAGRSPQRLSRCPRPRTISHFDALLRVPAVAGRAGTPGRAAAGVAAGVEGAGAVAGRARRLAGGHRGGRRPATTRTATSTGWWPGRPGPPARPWRRGSRPRLGRDRIPRREPDGWVERWAHADAVAAESIADVLSRHRRAHRAGHRPRRARRLPGGARWWSRRRCRCGTSSGSPRPGRA